MEKMPAPRYISSLPVRLQNALVTYFPRKYFGFLRHAIQDKYYSHPLLLCKPLRQGPAPALPSGYRFGCIEDVNDPALAHVMAQAEALPAEVYHNRLAKGDWCYFLSVNGEIVNYQWISKSHGGVLRGFDRGVDFVPLAPHQAYTYDFYTYRNKRRQGYGTILKQQVLAELAARRYSEIMSCVMYDNRESLKIHAKLNYRLIGLPCNYRLMNWSWTRWGSPAQVQEASQWLEQFTRNNANRSERS